MSILRDACFLRILDASMLHTNLPSCCKSSMLLYPKLFPISEPIVAIMELKVIITGPKVHDVGFRYFLMSNAIDLGLSMAFVPAMG